MNIWETLILILFNVRRNIIHSCCLFYFQQTWCFPWWWVVAATVPWCPWWWWWWWVEAARRVVVVEWTWCYRCWPWAVAATCRWEWWWWWWWMAWEVAWAVVWGVRWEAVVWCNKLVSSSCGTSQCSRTSLNAGNAWNAGNAAWVKRRRTVHRSACLVERCINNSSPAFTKQTSSDDHIDLHQHSPSIVFVDLLNLSIKSMSVSRLFKFNKIFHIPLIVGLILSETWKENDLFILLDGPFTM